MKTTTEKIAELEKSHKANIAKLKREEILRAMLPEHIREDASICIHSDHASVKCWNDFRTDKKLSDAVDIVNHFAAQLVIGEHWKDGCINTWPAEINTCFKNDKSTMVGSHAVEISVHGGKGFGPDVKVEFWAKFPKIGLIKFSCPTCDLWKLIPRVDANYDKRGELLTCRIDWPAESRCVDSFRTWWSEKPGFRGSYYLADLPNFYSWAGAILAPKAVVIN